MRIGLGFNLSIWSMPLVKNKSITGDRKSFRISTAGRWSASWFPQRWLQVGWWQNDKKRPCQNVPLSTVSECICCHRPLRGACLPLYYASVAIRSNSAPASAWWYHRPLITSQIPDDGNYIRNPASSDAESLHTQGRIFSANVKNRRFEQKCFKVDNFHLFYSIRLMFRGSFCSC